MLFQVVKKYRPTNTHTTLNRPSKLNWGRPCEPLCPIAIAPPLIVWQSNNWSWCRLKSVIYWGKRQTACCYGKLTFWTTLSVHSECPVTLSRQLGDIVYEYCTVQPRYTKHCLHIAQRIYLSTDSHVQAMVCMVRLGDVETALEYAEQQRCDTEQLAQVCDVDLWFCRVGDFGNATRSRLAA